MKKIKIELIEDGKLPSKAHESDSCYDVFAREVVHTHRYIAYKLGFKTEIPEGYEGEIRARSSISKYDLVLANGVGTIDQDYRGEWEVRFKIALPNMTLSDDDLRDGYGEEGPNIYKVGDKVAQIKFVKKEEIEFEQTTVSDSTDRSDGGFGSTDK